MACTAFGFSVGDLISGITLMVKLGRVLNDTTGARESYRRLIGELKNLDEALGLVQIICLEANTDQSPQIGTLLRALGQCQLISKAFLDQNARFKKSLSIQPSESAWKTNWNRIRWAFCKDGAIEELRTELTAHVHTMTLMLGAIQLSATRAQSEAVDSCRQLMKSVSSDLKEILELAKRNDQPLITQMKIPSTLDGLSSEEPFGELQSLFRTVLDLDSDIQRPYSSYRSIRRARSN